MKQIKGVVVNAEKDETVIVTVVIACAERECGLSSESFTMERRLAVSLIKQLAGALQ